MAGGWASSSLEVEGESEGWGGVVGGCPELVRQKLKKLRGTVDNDFRIEMGIKLTRDLRDHSSDLLLCLCLDGQKAWELVVCNLRQEVVGSGIRIWGCLDGKSASILHQQAFELAGSRDTLNHFRSMRRTPEIAFDVTSLKRMALSSSTAGSVPSSLLASCPFAKPFRWIAEAPLIFRLPWDTSPLSSARDKLLGTPFCPLLCVTSAETLANTAFHRTMTTDWRWGREFRLLRVSRWFTCGNFNTYVEIFHSIQSSLYIFVVCFLLKFGRFKLILSFIRQLISFHVGLRHFRIG